MVLHGRRIFGIILTFHSKDTTTEIGKVDSWQFVVWVKTSGQLLYLPVKNTRNITANTDDNRLSDYTLKLYFKLYFYLISVTELDKHQLVQQMVL